MKITLGTTTLCHGANVALGAYTGPESLRLALRREAQVRQAIDAEEASLAARKNAVWTIAFGVVAEFASVEAALAAAQTLAEDIQETGETPAVLTLGEDANATEWQQAIITGFDAEPIGCALRVSYTLTATKVKKAVS